MRLSFTIHGLPKHPRFKNLTGRRFSNLVAKEFSGMCRRGSVWLCRCDCGNSVQVLGVSLTSGNSGSCGCVKRQRLVTRNTTHNLSRSFEYNVWAKIIERCTRATAENFPWYGGRGISVCDRWRTFELFIADMGAAPGKGFEIDRIDNDGNYEPGNCRWVTKKQNARNRRNNHRLTFAGKTLCISEWAELTGLRAAAISERIASGWPVEKALTKPLKRMA